MADPSDRVVVDASVAVKWLIPEERSAAAEALRDRYLHAPTLLWIEVGNVLRTLTARGDMSTAKTAAAHDLILDAPVTLREPAPALMRDALAIAQTLSQTLYDCLYLALAIDLGSPLVTADHRLYCAADSQNAIQGTVRLLENASA